MILDEAESKSLLRRHGVPTPRGEVASSAAAVPGAAQAVGFPAVVKALVPFGGRGKLGAVRVVRSRGEAASVAEEIERRFSPRGFLVEEYIEHDAEYYLSIALSRRDRCFVLLASAHGGVDVEELAAASPPASIKIDPLVGLKPYHALYAAKKVGLKGDLARQFRDLALTLYEVVVGEDALLAEVNPLADAGGRLVALDAKVVLDDNAAFRRPAFEVTPRDLLEELASRHGLSFVRLSGDVAVVGNGAGLVLATMDLVKLLGGEPACFVDVGGGASPERVAAALKLASQLPGVKSVFVNIFGGITKCDEVASGIVSALPELKGVKLAVRLSGTNEEEGAEILRRAGGEPFAAMEEAARRAVELARGGKA